MRENFGSAAKQSASGMPSSFRYSVRSLHQSNDLVERVAAAHAFTTHSAVGGDRETLGRHVLQRLPQKIGDFFGAFDLQLAGTQSAVWTVTGVRAHSSTTDAAGPFAPVSVTLTVQ
jgi:hypothetical protein